MAEPGSLHSFNLGEPQCFFPSWEAVTKLSPPPGDCAGLEQETSECFKLVVGIFAALKALPFPALSLPATPGAAGGFSGSWRAVPTLCRVSPKADGERWAGGQRRGWLGAGGCSAGGSRWLWLQPPMGEAVGFSPPVQPGKL